MALTADDIKLLKDALAPEFDRIKQEIKSEVGTQNKPVDTVMPPSDTEFTDQLKSMMGGFQPAAPAPTPPAAAAVPVMPTVETAPPASVSIPTVAADDGTVDSDGEVDPTNLLAKFAQSDFSGMKQVVKFVQEGHKLDNAAMQELLFRLKSKHNMTYRELLSIYLTMDMAVEKGALTNDIIDYLKKNPQMIQKF